MEKNLKIAVCDDEREFAEQIHTEIDKILKKYILSYDVRVFTDSIELIDEFQSNPFDIVFLDIDMPSANGFDTAGELQSIFKDVYIVFVTSHDDMVYQSYVYHPFWFVRKKIFG